MGWHPVLALVMGNIISILYYIARMCNNHQGMDPLKGLGQKNKMHLLLRADMKASFTFFCTGFFTLLYKDFR